MSDPGDGYRDNASVRFSEDIRERIDYFREEFDLTYAAAIGCLTLLAHELANECIGKSGDD